LTVTGLPGEVRPDRIEGFVVTVSGWACRTRSSRLSRMNIEVLMAEQVTLLEGAGRGRAQPDADRVPRWPTGRRASFSFPPYRGACLFAHFSIEEIHELVSAIAQSALSPVEGAICRQP
jgi:hypothetical protein